MELVTPNRPAFHNSVRDIVCEFQPSFLRVRKCINFHVSGITSAESQNSHRIPRKFTRHSMPPVRLLGCYLLPASSRVCYSSVTMSQRGKIPCMKLKSEEREKLIDMVEENGFHKYDPTCVDHRILSVHTQHARGHYLAR